jgi:hypothetical protein
VAISIVAFIVPGPETTRLTYAVMKDRKLLSQPVAATN